MDPQAAWERLLEEYRACQWEEVEAVAQGLMEWLERGGFPPCVTAGAALGPDWDRVIVMAVARFARRRARREKGGR